MQCWSNQIKSSSNEHSCSDSSLPQQLIISLSCNTGLCSVGQIKSNHHQMNIHVLTVISLPQQLSNQIKSSSNEHSCSDNYECSCSDNYECTAAVDYQSVTQHWLMQFGQIKSNHRPMNIHALTIMSVPQQLIISLSCNTGLCSLVKSNQIIIK